MKQRYALLALLGVASVVQAQKNPRNPTLSVGVQVVQPLGQFADVYQGYPAGFTFSIMAPVERSPLELGVGMAWNSMGSESEDVIIATGVYDIDGDEIVSDGTMRITNNNFRYTGQLRFRPFAGMIQPYADLLAGFETYSTASVITLDDSDFQERLERKVYHRDMSFCAGWGAGLGFEISEGIVLSGGFQSLRGSEATYVNRDSIRLDENQQLGFDTSESATDKYTWSLSAVVRF